MDMSGCGRERSTTIRVGRNSSASLDALFLSLEPPDHSAGVVKFGLKSYSCRLISCCIKGRVGAPVALQLKAVTHGPLYVWTVCFPPNTLK